VTGYSDPLPVESTAPDLQQPEELIGGATEDEILDGGSETADHYSVGQGFGNTAREMAQGESLEQRLAEEVPDVGAPGDRADLDEDEDEDEIRLTDPDLGSGTDTEADMIGSAVTDTADRSAEETAIHIVDEP
jgi:Family of unknown function (DUF5709)